MEFDPFAIGRFTQTHPELFVVGILTWLVGVTALSAVIRIRRERPIFARVPDDAIFTEKRTSGRSLRNFISRFGGANNALLVVVTPQRLIVQPHFPLTLMFLPGIYGLELELNATQLRKAEEKNGPFRKTVLLEYALPSRGDERLELRLRNPEGFLKAIQVLKARRPPR